MGYIVMVMPAPRRVRHVRQQVEALGKDDRHEWHECRFTTGDLNRTPTIHTAGHDGRRGIHHRPTPVQSWSPGIRESLTICCECSWERTC